MTRTTIFLSHISEEAELAKIFKSEIEDRFLGLVDVFVSSDAGNIALGKNWLDKITDGLKNCSATLLLCSPYSIKRPWINFECGAGWARDIDIAPICHSGLRPVDLPIPVSLLQGLEASDSQRIEEVFSLIARKINSRVPVANPGVFLGKIVSFENNYIEKTEIVANLQAIRMVSVDLFNMFLTMMPRATHAVQQLPERIFLDIKTSFDSMQIRKYLSYNYGVNGVGFTASGQSGGGNFGTLTLTLNDKIISIAKTL